MEASTLISISAVVVSFLTFVMTRLDKKEEKVKGNHQDLIEYQLSELKTDVKELLRKVDSNNEMIEKKIDEKIDLHIKLFHKGKNNVNKRRFRKNGR